MKSTGIVRPLDAVGRIVLPMEIRKKLGITERNDALEIYTEGDKIILKKYA
ncbi:MAG: AbrB/MazE/SpoVT family DNA-binding domain-containing protein, partial [Clostridia bacterium]|nr:AbrB/MazE/SpoVT family DNA-binding domain-containing protein [Clostridia bacterium]